jgi:hypothetical protein
MGILGSWNTEREDSSSDGKMEILLYKREFKGTVSTDTGLNFRRNAMILNIFLLLSSTCIENILQLPLKLLSNFWSFY